jgi:hypothetical protein
VFEVLLTAGIAAAAVALGWTIARWTGPIGTRRHRSALLLASVVAFVLGSATLMPPARAWKQERDVEALLESEPLFSAHLADDHSLREPLRARLLQAVREGPRDEASLAGQRLLSPRSWRYVPRASDGAALDLGRALVAALERLEARDPQQCYRFLFPAVPGPPTGAAEPGDEGILKALGQVVLSARDGSAEPLDRTVARRHLDAVFARLRERHGADVDVLRRAEDAGVDRGKVCAMRIALYEELIALPAPAAGQALRHVLGPEEPAAPGRWHSQLRVLGLALRRLPGLEDLGLAIGGDAGAQLGLPLGGQRLPPGQRVGRRLPERPEGEADGDGLLVAAAVGARGVPGRWDPDRHVAPRADLLLLEEVRPCPDELGL